MSGVVARNVLTELDLSADDVACLRKFWQDTAAEHTSDSATVNAVIADALKGVGPDEAAADEEAAAAFLSNQAWWPSLRTVTAPGTGRSAESLLLEVFAAGAKHGRATCTDDGDED